MTNKTSYTINTKSISFEIFEEEVVLINLRKGIYYSLDGVGKVIWEQLQQNLSTEAIIQKIDQLYQGDSKEITSAVLEFLKDLKEEEIVLETTQKTFAPPLLHKHHDLKDLLLLDPIHEVNEAGWPALK